MFNRYPFASRLPLVWLAVGGLLLPGCERRKEEAAPKDSGPAAVKVVEKEPAGMMSMKLNEPQVALDFLEQSGLKLQDANEDCALLGESHATLGALVRNARERANSKSIQCEAAADSQTWSCTADFMNSGGAESEVSDFALSLRFNVDDTKRAIQPESLVCLMAG